MPDSLGSSTSSQPLQQQAPTSSNGSSVSNTEMDVTASPSAPQLRQLPGHFEDVSMDDLVELIADLLDRIIALNDQLPLNEDALTRFHSRSPPTISVLEYLKRIVRYIPRIERSVLLLLLYYIDRICARLQHFTVSSLTVHRFILASVTVASKAFCDAFATNPQFARVGGVSLVELNLLEKEFLAVLDWRLACTRELLQAYYVKLAQTHSSGLYVVLDAGPRPTRIDTLPSHLIEWTVPPIGIVPPPREASSSNGIIRHDEPDSSESSESEPEQPQRRFLPAVPRSASSLESSHSPHRSHVAPPPQPALSASISVPTSRVTSPSTSFGRPPQGFRSPMIGRRRRRPSLIDPTSRAAAEMGSDYDVDVTALEGTLRGSRRRRIEIDDGRKGEPGTPV